MNVSRTFPGSDSIYAQHPQIRAKDFVESDTQNLYVAYLSDAISQSLKMPLANKGDFFGALTSSIHYEFLIAPLDFWLYRDMTRKYQSIANTLMILSYKRPLECKNRAFPWVLGDSIHFFTRNQYEYAFTGEVVHYTNERNRASGYIVVSIEEKGKTNSELAHFYSLQQQLQG